MRTNEVSNSVQPLAQRERLQKVASGESVRWRELLLLLLGVSQFFLGALALVVLGPGVSSVFLLASGVLFVALAIWQVLNARIDTIWEVVSSTKRS